MISRSQINKLRSVEIIVRKGKRNLNAYTATNKQFIEWIAKKMMAGYAEHRLNFRLELLRLVREIL